MAHQHAAGRIAPETVVDGLKRLYKQKIKPVEEMYQFDDFYSPLLRDSDFDANPMVLLLGQYSVGKTTFIQYLLGRDFPGIRIGPEPTTDRFVAVMHGSEDRTIPGNALAVHKDLPFTSLTRFGTSFLNKFEAAQCDAELLKHVILIDTPGVLAGEKQRIGRSYDFPAVVEWFAQRADMILLLFDAHKLDISDEFKRTILALRGQDDKIRVVLNKADRVSGQQLMRVYGALMWSLGKVVQTPEVMRVYIGSFWNEGYANPEYASLFQKEQNDLLRDLMDLPRNAAIRKINELVKRARVARVHALIVAYLRSKMPSFFGKSSKQAELLRTLPDVFFAVMKKYKLARGDFPPLDRFREACEGLDFSRFPKLNEKLLNDMDTVLSTDIPHLLSQLGEEQAARASAQAVGHALPSIMDASSSTATASPVATAPPPAPTTQIESPSADTTSGNPFGTTTHSSTSEQSWESIVNKTMADEMFTTLPGAEEGRVPGGAVSKVMSESGLPREILSNIWELSDIDKDGYLDAEEFALCLHLVNEAGNGQQLPAVLPARLVPPSKR